jgi:hypothetical protein
MTRAARCLVLVVLVGCAGGGGDLDPDSDGTTPPALGPDVDGVAFRDVGLMLAVASLNGEASADLDVNDDGTPDFELQLGRFAEADSVFRSVYLQRASEGAEVLVGEVPNAGVFGGMDTATRALALGERIEGSSATWQLNGVLHEVEMDADTVEDDYGIAGEGRVFLGVRFITGVSDLLNGWIEVSVDEDVSTFTVHRAGWAELPEVGLGAGDR